MERKTETSYIYLKLNTENIQKYCPGSIYDRKRDISIMIMEYKQPYPYKLFMKDIVYLSLEDAYKKYILNNDNTYPEPYSNLSVIFPDILKSRIISQINYEKIEEKYNLQKLFENFILEKESETERVILDNELHFDDNLVDWKLPSDFDLRTMATNVLNESSKGSWLIRRSSIKEQDHIKVRVISLKENVILNYLFVRINGFGYALINGISGQVMPKIGDNIPVEIQVSSKGNPLVFYSLPDVLEYMKNQGISLSNIINKKE
jgi:hypothetical protein